MAQGEKKGKGIKKLLLMVKGGSFYCGDLTSPKNFSLTHYTKNYVSLNIFSSEINSGFINSSSFPGKGAETISTTPEPNRQKVQPIPVKLPVT